jgi:hypothetical protein
LVHLLIRIQKQHDSGIYQRKKKYLQHIDNKTIAGEFETLSINDKSTTLINSFANMLGNLVKNQLLQQFGSNISVFLSKKLFIINLLFYEESMIMCILQRKGYLFQIQLLRNYFMCNYYEC